MKKSLSSTGIHYTAEKNTLILISLLKEHNIKKIIISPGSTNICFSASVQQDKYFEIYSVVDERSAAYIACGLAAESGEPVVISCTGATASRNYMPALTEAFYRHLPILAVTSTQSIERVGHNIPQVLDRSVVPRDIVKMSVHIPNVIDEETEWSCAVKINKAILELTRGGGNPVHIDLTTSYTPDFSTVKLPETRKIERLNLSDKMPVLDGNNKKVAIFVGAHLAWTSGLTSLVDRFCELYNAVVLCDQTSNYWGKYRVLPNVLCIQKNYRAMCTQIDILIHIGEVSGAYMQIYPLEVWRVHPDGEVKDTFKKLKYVFEMNEKDFFEKFLGESSQFPSCSKYFNEWEKECDFIMKKLPELPFSNVWVAQQTAGKIPEDSSIHFGILNSLRSWNYFELTKGTLGFCNTGGFGIDGGVSSLIGASLARKDKLFFGVIGDLTFFYDMNAMGNRHIGSNIRLIVINNGKGNEFRNYGNWGAPLGDFADEYIAAARHYGNKSRNLLKHFAEDLGFIYLSAANKQEYMDNLPMFVNSEMLEKSIVFEVFTDTECESKAIEIIMNLEKDPASVAKSMIKDVLKKKADILTKNL